MGKYMRVNGPIEFVDHPAGEPMVAKPPRERQCWALSINRYGGRPFRCSLYATLKVGGRLCCTNHRRMETAARELKAKLESEAAE